MNSYLKGAAGALLGLLIGLFAYHVYLDHLMVHEIVAAIVQSRQAAPVTPSELPPQK